MSHSKSNVTFNHEGELGDLPYEAYTDVISFVVQSNFRTWKMNRAMFCSKLTPIWMWAKSTRHSNFNFTIDKKSELSDLLYDAHTDFKLGDADASFEVQSFKDDEQGDLLH